MPAIVALESETTWQTGGLQAYQVAVPLLPGSTKQRDAAVITVREDYPFACCGASGGKFSTQNAQLCNPQLTAQIS